MTARPELARLLGVADPADFLARHWQGEPLVRHGALDRLLELPGLASIGTTPEQALDTYAGPVMVYGDAVVDAADGLSDRMLVPPGEALSWLERGAALEMDFADMYVPELRRWIGKLRDELGLPAGTSAKAVFYAGDGGGGLLPHFDGYANFVMQLSGRKSWSFAPNTTVTDALTHYEAAEAPFVPAELASYWSGPTADVKPPELETVELTAGSLLFMPRGSWHATASSARSLAVNITFGQPPWLDFLLAEIRARVVTSLDWRSLAHGAVDPGRDITRTSVTADMIADALRRCADITPVDVLARQDERTDQYYEVQRVVRQVLQLP